MKYAHKHLIAAALLATLGLAANAQTPAPASPPAGAAPAATHHMGHGDSAKMKEHMAKRLAALKTKLAITPAQEGAWTTWTSALQPPADMKRPDRAELAKLTTPERIDRMRALRAERSALMDKRAEATKTFYAALTPEQKKVFDAQPMGHGGHRPGGPGMMQHKG